MTDAPIDVNGKPNRLRDAITAFFAARVGTRELRPQPCNDRKTMPVEDASVPRPADASPNVTVVWPTVMPQSAWGAERAAVINDHQLLGGAMRPRKPVNAVNATMRAALNRCPMHKPRLAD